MEPKNKNGREMSLVTEITNALGKVELPAKKAARLALHKIKNIYNRKDTRPPFYPDECQTPESVREESFRKFNHFRF